MLIINEYIHYLTNLINTGKTVCQMTISPPIFKLICN